MEYVILPQTKYRLLNHKLKTPAMQIRWKGYLFFPMHNGHFFDSYFAFKLVQLRNTEYGHKFGDIISKVVLDQFKSITLQKELREIPVGD